MPPYLRDQSYATPHARTPQYKSPPRLSRPFCQTGLYAAGYEHTVYYRPTGQGQKPSSATGMHADLEKVMKHELKRKPDVQKTTMLAIVVNAVQIGVLFAFVL